MGSVFGSRSEAPRTTTSVVSTDPPAFQKPFIEFGLEQARSFYDDPRSYYTGSTVVPFSGQTTEALTGIENRARAGSPLVTGAQSQVAKTMAGDYLNPATNPYLTSAMDAATRPMREAFTEDVLPSIDTAFSQAGRYGSGLQARQQQRAAEDYLQSLGDVGSRMAYSNYADERARQEAATSAAPAMAELDYLGLERLGQVGAAQEELAARQLQEDIDRFNFAQEEGRQRLAEYLPQVTGGQYSTQTTAQPLYSDDTARYLGYGATGANILGGLFGADRGGTSAFEGLKGFFG